MSEREQKWQTLNEAWQTSNLSGAAFCRAQGLVYHQFLYWQHKVQQREKHPSDAEAKQLIPVQLTHQATANTAPLQLQLPNGIVIRDVTSANVQTVTQLLRLL
ncbi:IS66 family insertion sequence element accessory protein TnpA [Gayadomonas joobiniege]|uniref:IS66 family insertion sequence element accessory protein TnpA n=1 Tax=Gayadomonas joobiniege TaxID=1234606 RepID=UPI00037363C3|nr:hypothetical protein [Gayadomonas joobiniege]